MWGGFIDNRLIGPWQLPDNLNGETYLEFSEDKLPELLDNVFTRHQQENMIFMHDGASPHYLVGVRIFK